MCKDLVKDNERILYLDLVKVVSAFCVIIIHIFSPLIAFYSDNISQNQLIFYKIIKYFCNWAVPCFVMVTGSLLLNNSKEISYKLMFTKYIPRILFSLLLFGFIYAWMEIIFNEKQISIFQIKKVLYNILTNKLWDHMWYLYMLLGIYLLIPMLKIFSKYTNEVDYVILLIILFASNSILPFIATIFNFTIGIQIQTASIYIFYLLLGSYISEKKTILKRISFLLIGTPTLFLVLLSCNIFNWTNLDNGFNYSSPMIVLMSVGIFSLIKNYSGQNKIIVMLANLSFTIYLIHPLFINIILKLFKINPSRYSVNIVVLILLIAIPFSSILFSYILCKIHLLKKYVL